MHDQLRPNYSPAPSHMTPIAAPPPPPSSLPLQPPSPTSPNYSTTTYRGGTLQHDAGSTRAELRATIKLRNEYNTLSMNTSPGHPLILPCPFRHMATATLLSCPDSRPRHRHHRSDSRHSRAKHSPRRSRTRSNPRSPPRPPISLKSTPHYRSPSPISTNPLAASAHRPDPPTTVYLQTTDVSGRIGPLGLPVPSGKNAKDNGSITTKNHLHQPHRPEKTFQLMKSFCPPLQGRSLCTTG